MQRFNTFQSALSHTLGVMKASAREMHRGKWQGVDVGSKPEMVAYEVLHHAFSVPMVFRNVDPYRHDIKPNLPWADHHFDERVGGHPLNPGKEWANWPWGRSADRFRIDACILGDAGLDRVFDHTYMQRYWPKKAGLYANGIIPSEDDPDYVKKFRQAHRGIYFEYGDLGDVVTELANDPTTRQAILPVFFPEDTGRANGRKPCSISYHFMLNTRRGLDIFYHLRSCDLIRHFQDDIYLTVRLLLWVLDRLRERNDYWKDIAPGDFVMYIGNLHCFKNDMIKLRGSDR